MKWSRTNQVQHGKKGMGKNWKLQELLSVRTGARIMDAPRRCEWFGLMSTTCCGDFFVSFLLHWNINKYIKYRLKVNYVSVCVVNVNFECMNRNRSEEENKLLFRLLELTFVGTVLQQREVSPIKHKYARYFILHFNGFGNAKRLNHKIIVLQRRQGFPRMPKFVINFKFNFRWIIYGWSSSFVETIGVRASMNGPQ